MQVDANAKLGSSIIPGDPHKTTEILQGKICIFWIWIKCVMVKSQDTEEKKTGEEKSIIDYILVCDVLKCYFEEMLIDD